MTTTAPLNFHHHKLALELQRVGLLARHGPILQVTPRGHEVARIVDGVDQDEEAESYNELTCDAGNPESRMAAG